MIGHFKNLSLITCDERIHATTCNYWYLIRSGGSTPHTAFTTRAALLRWLEERGLHLTAALPEHGAHSWQPLLGSYRRRYLWSYDEFFALKGERTRSLSNGDWTLAILTPDEHGEITESLLNPNCRDRPVFDYAESCAIYL